MKQCPICEGDGYTLDRDGGWGSAGPGDYDGPPAPEYSECAACHGTGQVADDFAVNDALARTAPEAAALELLNSVKHIFFDTDGYGRI